MEPINLDEYEVAASERLDAGVYAYIAGGAEDEYTLRRNRTAFGGLMLRPRVLAGTPPPDLRTTVLGCQVALPVLLAPTTLQRLAHPDGELAATRAAAATGAIYVAPTTASYSLEEIAAAATTTLWFQLYCLRDRRLTEALVRRAETAGYRALCLTGDSPISGRRERDRRSGFSLPADYPMPNLTAPGMPPPPANMPLAVWANSLLDPTVSWDDVSWLRSITSLPVILKGVMDGDDAQQAVNAGVAALIVSNHGGRQLDSAPSTIEVLPEVVAAVAGRCEVYLDGGIRRGTDIVKALALGARAVLIGRPYVWGLAVAGEAGVRRVLQLLEIELSTALILCGCAAVRGIDRRVIRAALSV